MPTKCTATTRQGLPCKAWAVPNSQPPLCGAHQPHPRPGAPTDNTNALKHGAYSEHPAPHGVGLQPVITDLARRIEDLGQYIDDRDTDNPLATTDYLEALNLLSLMSTRLARVIKDQRALEGQGHSDLEEAIADALDTVGRTLGTVL